MTADNTIDVIILAGGRGTRLQSVVSDVPKPLAPVNGRPFLDYQFALLQKAPQIGKVVLAIGHLADRVIEHYTAHKPALDLSFAVETVSLGTAGGLRHALSLTASQQILALNGDSIFNWDVAALREAHCRLNAKATISLLEVGDVSRYGSVRVQNGLATSFHEKSVDAKPGSINGGVYLFDRAVIEKIAEGQQVSLEREILPVLAEERKLAAVSFKSDFIDIGLPETYKLAEPFMARFGDI